MGIPTITNITPSTGPASGISLVKITGTNFRLYTPAAYGNLSSIEPTPTVQVLFGDQASASVLVESDTELVALLPQYAGVYQVHELPVVDITIRNLDDNGSPIAGEEVVASDSFTYQRDPLRPPTLDIESPFKRISEGFVELLRRQILLDSGINTNTDYSPDGVVTKLAGVPSLTLLGPDTAKDAYGARNISYWEEQPDTSAVQWPPPEMTTFIYDLVGQSDNMGELLTLVGATRKFFRANPYYVMNADVPAGSYVRFPVQVTGEPVKTGMTADANLSEFTLTFEVRRIPILYMPPMDRTWKIEELELQVQKVGGILLETSTVW